MSRAFDIRSPSDYKAFHVGRLLYRSEYTARFLVVKGLELVVADRELGVMSWTIRQWLSHTTGLQIVFCEQNTLRKWDVIKSCLFMNGPREEMSNISWLCNYLFRTLTEEKRQRTWMKDWTSICWQQRLWWRELEVCKSIRVLLNVYSVSTLHCQFAFLTVITPHAVLFYWL